MNRQTFAHLATACALAVAASTSHAALVTTWDYEISLQWSTAAGDTVFDGTGGNQAVSPTLISWGAPGTIHPGFNSSRSGLEITDTPATGSVQTNGAWAPTNSITHYNNVLSSSYGTLRSAKLIADVSLSVDGTELVGLINPFEIYFIETSNSRPCLPGSATVCDDVFVLTMGALNHQFEYDGFTYYASIFETTNNIQALPGAACASAGSTAPCIGFMTPEGQNTPARFAFTITSTPITVQVPEPNAVALLGIGLAGVGLFRRRRDR